MDPRLGFRFLRPLLTAGLGALLIFSPVLNATITHSSALNLAPIYRTPPVPVENVLSQPPWLPERYMQVSPSANHSATDPAADDANTVSPTAPAIPSPDAMPSLNQNGEISPSDAVPQLDELQLLNKPSRDPFPDLEWLLQSQQVPQESSHSQPASGGDKEPLVHDVRDSQTVAAPTADTTPTPNVALSGPPIPFHEEISSAPPGTVALTIDDGPSPFTEDLLHVLASYHVHVTFFMIGSQMKMYPQAVKDAVAGGNMIGYHTWDHKDLSKLTEDQQQYEMFGQADWIQTLVPYPITLFRPPYGSVNAVTKSLLDSHHTSLVLWNADPRDWSFSQPSAVANAVLATAHSGSMIVMHDKKATVQALPTIIEGIFKKGLTFSVVRQTPVSSNGSSQNRGGETDAKASNAQPSVNTNNRSAQ